MEISFLDRVFHGEWFAKIKKCVGGCRFLDFYIFLRYVDTRDLLHIWGKRRKKRVYLCWKLVPRSCITFNLQSIIQEQHVLPITKNFLIWHIIFWFCSLVVQCQTGGLVTFKLKKFSVKLKEFRLWTFLNDSKSSQMVPLPQKHLRLQVRPLMLLVFQ